MKMVTQAVASSSFDKKRRKKSSCQLKDVRARRKLAPGSASIKCDRSGETTRRDTPLHPRAPPRDSLVPPQVQIRTAGTVLQHLLFPGGLGLRWESVVGYTEKGLFPGSN
uniref:Uncharacterized protein n=1 Tax=Setaria digitata TaxID=48799 RepID=A0A915PCK4_9BILA